MTLRELMEQIKDLPPDTLVCAAEVDEAFGANVAGVRSWTMPGWKAKSRTARNRSNSPMGGTGWS